MIKNDIQAARELTVAVREIIAKEFPSTEALNKYLKDHPDAKKSDHTVKKTETKKPNLFAPSSLKKNDHPYLQMQQRKHEKKMTEIAKHHKKDVKDVTNDDIIKYNQRGKKKSSDARVAQELVAVAKSLVSSARKPKYSIADIEKLADGLRGYIKRNGREYGDYQFNIKLTFVDTPDSVTEEYGENLVSDFATEEAANRVESLGENVQSRFGWVSDWVQAGRSGGWFGVEDSDTTIDDLEEAIAVTESLKQLGRVPAEVQEVTHRGGPQDKDELWEELEEEVDGAVKEGQQKLKDLAEIEKMVKAGIAGYKKDMNSKQWWKSNLG